MANSIRSRLLPGGESALRTQFREFGLNLDFRILSINIKNYSKADTFGQPDLFIPKLMQLNFDPGVENRISVWKYSRKLGMVKRASSGSSLPSSSF